VSRKCRKFRGFISANCLHTLFEPNVANCPNAVNVFCGIRVAILRVFGFDGMTLHSIFPLAECPEQRKGRGLCAVSR
jgi:hypothetical protein